MAPAPSRITPSQGDAFINNGPHWTTGLPQDWRDAWGLVHLPALPPEYDSESASSSSFSFSSPPRPAPSVSPPRLPRSTWHSAPDTHIYPHQYDQYAYQDHPDAPQYQGSLQGQQQPQAQDYQPHPHSHHLDQTVPQSQPARHSTQPPDSPPPPYLLHPDLSEKLFDFTQQTVDKITNTLGADRFHALALEGPTESTVRELESAGSCFDRELNLLFEDQVESETQEAIDWMIKEPAHWPLDESLESVVNESLQEMIKDSAEAVADPSKHSCASPPPSSFDVGNTDVVEAPAEPNKRVRVRLYKNKAGRKKRRERQLQKMARRTSNHPEPASGSPGDASPNSIADTIIGSDIDVARSPSPPPSRLPLPTEAMPVVPSAPANPKAPPKKKQKAKKKKGKIQAEKAGDNISWESLDAQLTASAAPAQEEEERAASLSAAPRVGDVSPHSVDQSENSWVQWPMHGQSVPAQHSHDGGHQIGYEQPWSGVVAGPSGDGPMCGFYPACCHHNGNPRCSCCCLHGPADCWYASDINSPRNTDLLVAAPPPPAADQELAPAVASLFEAYRMSKMSSPKSSSLGEPVSEPIVESGLLSVVDRQSSRASSASNQAPNEPAVVSSTADTDTTLDACTIQETTPVNNSQNMSLRQAHPSQFLTPEDLKSPSLYFDAKSKNPSSSVLASSESNEASRDTSRKPSTAASNDPEEKGASISAEDTPENRNQGCQNLPTDTRQQSPQPEAIGPLAFQTEHVKALFCNLEFADIQLLLSPELSHPLIVYNLHKAIIAGSPFLHDVMAAKRHRDGGVDHIRAFTGISFSCSYAFTMALQVLYGVPLVTKETLRKFALQGLGLPDDNGTGTYSFSIERALVDFALCYAAAGAFLARREITERGIDLAIDHISWETAEFILSFGMTPVTYMVTCPDVPFSPISPANSRSSSLSIAHDTGTPVAGLDHFHDFHYVQAQRAQNAALQFITAAVTPEFELYRRAQAHYTPSRIPPALHTLPGSLLSNPRLEEIRFGSFPSFADLRPTDQAILVPSAMLITLPYPVFMAALDTMKARGNLRTELIKEVVEEREARRLNALRVSLRVDPSKVAPEAYEELKYREFATMEPSENTNDQNADALRAPVDRVFVGDDFPNKALLRPRRRAPANGSGPSRARNAT